MGTSAIRDIDEQRAAQMVAAQIARDELMFADAVNETFADDYKLGELQLGSAINVFRSMSRDLAGALVDIHGQELAEQLMRGMLANFPHDVGDER